MIELQEPINKEHDSKFWICLLNCIFNSIDQLSLENKFFLNFIGMFENMDDKHKEINWDMDFSKCFYELVLLNNYQLRILYDFITYVEINLAKDIIVLCQGEIFRGKRDIKWLLDLNFFYGDLIDRFSKVKKLSTREIINYTLQGNCPEQEKYFIKLLHNRYWYSLSKNEMLDFLKGYDFHYLSDKAYHFILLSCIKVFIDIFKEDSTSLPEKMCFFLKDKSRALYADLEIRKLVKEFIQLLSYEPYNFLTFNIEDSDELMRIWTTK